MTNRQTSDCVRRSLTMWKNIAAKRGRRAFIARQLGLKWQTLAHWNHVPLEHVFTISTLLRIPPEDLRPDFFKDDPLRRLAFQNNRGNIAAQSNSVPMKSVIDASAAVSVAT